VWPIPPPFPKNLPDFVLEVGGGGFWSCEAVGARDCLIEYVRCMIADYGRRLMECVVVMVKVFVVVIETRIIDVSELQR
jgi:hypothetical protein